MDAVNSLSELKNQVGVSSVSTIYLLGYYEPGDGGGGRFFWDGTSIEGDDGGTIIKPAVVSGAGRWKRDFSSSINARWFGAKGEDINDSIDTIAINRAIGALKVKGGGSLYLPRGIYAVTDHIVVDFGNVYIYGDGMGASTLKCYAWVDGLRVANGYPPPTPIASILKNIIIENLAIDGNRSGYINGPNDTYGNGINLNGCDQVIIKNCRVINQAEQGIVITNFVVGSATIKSLEISSCIVENTQSNRIAIGIEGQSKSAKIINNTLINGGCLYTGCEGCGNTDTGTNNTGSHIIEGNRLTGTSVSPVGISLVNHSEECIVSNNVIDNYVVGIRTYNVLTMNSDAAVKQNIIVGNIITNFSESGILLFPPPSTSTTKSTVSNNRLRAGEGAREGIRIVADSTCIGNTIEGSFEEGCIYLSGNNNVVVGNNCELSDSPSINMSSTQNNTIMSNRIKNDIYFDGTPSNDYGFNFGATISRSRRLPLDIAFLYGDRIIPSPAFGEENDILIGGVRNLGSNYVYVKKDGDWIGSGILGSKQIATQANSAATTLSELTTAFNNLLDKLKQSKLME